MEKEYIKQMMALPDDWWQFIAISQKMSEWFSKHLLPLFILVRSGDEKQYGLYTGSLLYYRKLLLWITAGHIIEEIKTIRNSSKIEVLRSRWLDRCQIYKAEDIPLDLSNIPMFSTEQQGIDFGMCLFTELYVQQLLSNDKIQIMNEVIWQDIDSANPEGYYLLGYPKEWSKFEEKEIDDNKIFNFLQANCACLPVKKIEYKGYDPYNSFWNDPDAFYGEMLPFIDSSEQPKSIKGISGGPLFSIERDPKRGYVYRLYGIQRSWHKNKRLIRVEPIPKIIQIMDKLDAT